MVHDVVWCGVVWCGVVWCGVVWCGVPAWMPQVRKWSGKKILQGQENVRDFFSGSGKIGILKKSQGKLKL